MGIVVPKVRHYVSAYLGRVDLSDGGADVYDRKVIGWAFSSDMETVHTTIAALRTAFQHRTAREGLVFHSDRGSRYYSKSFPDALRACCPTVRQSMRWEGELLGQWVHRIFFQNPETGIGNGGRQTFRGGGQTIGVHVS
jgi:transposase InsO family protein